MINEHIATYLVEQHQAEAQEEDPRKKRHLIFQIPAQPLRKELQKAFEDTGSCTTKILEEFDKPSEQLELLSYHKEEIKTFCNFDQALSIYELNQETLSAKLEVLKLA